MAERYLFIDANNMCYRVFWGHRNLSHNGVPVSLLYGFFKALAQLKTNYPERQMVIVWDSKSKRRMAESTEAVVKTLVPSAYKANRRDKSDMDSEFAAMFAQMGILREKLSLINAVQVFVQDFEADDVIFTYVKNLPQEDDVVVVTTDKDYYQMLRENVVLYDAMNKVTIAYEDFKAKYGIEPSQWVDVGALSGDKSDNIFGVYGWGDVTSLKYVKEHGTVETLITFLQAKQNRSKKEDALVGCVDRLTVAKSLKSMDIVPELPQIDRESNLKTLNKKELHDFFIQNGFVTLMTSEGRLLS